MTLADYPVSADEIATLSKLVGEPAQFWAAVTDRGPWVALARLRALELAGVKVPPAKTGSSEAIANPGDWLVKLCTEDLDRRIELWRRTGR